eukprot:TRINITY_DN7583_c0_g1_i1.p1 TRINITY_DN7583_c0_g1~~TRINITY_DN7583_c0_g1_i1.p1  ORF type:complete len:120 (-),score=18.31 TRINITY_DN7583_c0_g1_i1:120-479(-)
MIACISPADNNYDETLSTLRYANRAKNIKNKPRVNEDPKDALLRQYQEELTALRQMLQDAGFEVPKPGTMRKPGMKRGATKILQQKDIVKLKKRLSSQGIVVNEDMQDALDTLSPNTKD